MGVARMLIFAGFIGGAAETVAGQSTATVTPMGEPVTVALVDRLPSLRDQRAIRDYDAVIVRRVDVGDVILLPKSKANGELLDAATRTLILARAHQAMRGDRRGEHRGRPVTDIKIGVTRTPAGKAWADRNVPKAQKVIDRLNASTTTREIPGIGIVKAVRFYPPKPPQPPR